MAQRIARWMSVGLFLVAGTAAAQESGSRSRQIKFDDITIVGKIQKPQVQFIISREQTSTDEALKLEATFLGRIPESVEREPF